MSDSNSNRKAAARQANSPPSDYQMGRWSLKNGALKSTVMSNKLLQGSAPDTKASVATHIGISALAGAKDYAKAMGHFGKGFINGVSGQIGDKTPAANKAILRSHAIAQGQPKANQMKQNRAYTPKAHKMNPQTQTNQPAPGQNKGIQGARQKMAQKQQSGAPQPGKSANKGLSSFQSKTGGQSAKTSKGSASSAIKGKSSSAVKSGGISSGGKSSAIKSGGSSSGGKSSGSSSGGKSGGSSSGGSSKGR